jgi:hypothetical protein
LDTVAEFEHTSRATTVELSAARIELIEIVAEAGERDEAIHTEGGDVDEEAEVANVGDQGWVGLGLVGLELGGQEGKEFHIATITLGVVGSALGFGEVGGDLAELARRQVMFGDGEEATVDDQIGIAADRRGEVGIFLFSQAVMAEGFDGIASTHEGTEEADFEGLADGQAVKFFEELLHLDAIGEVAALDVMAEDVLAVFLEPPVVGGFVNAVESGAIQGHEPGGDGLVGQEHEFFDELMRGIVFDLFDAQDSAALVEPDFGFGEVKVQ